MQVVHFGDRDDFAGRRRFDRLGLFTLDRSSGLSLTSLRTPLTWTDWSLATVLDNVADGLLYTGMSLDGRRELATMALDRVGMGHRLDHVATKLSGGERQRVAVARAVIGRPAIVLADEPTGNLDSKSSDAIVELLEELNEEGTTLIVITHNREIAEQFPRMVGILDGRIEYDRPKVDA